MGNMRLKAEIIIAAELKSAQSLGLFATIAQKGDESAGQIYVIINKNNSEFILIGPPFGASFDSDGQKLWCYPLGEAPITEPQVNEYLQKIGNFDPDIYILEIEDRTLTYRPMGVFTVNEEGEAALLKRQAENLFKGIK